MTIELNLTNGPYAPPVAPSTIPAINGMPVNQHLDRIAKDSEGQYYVVTTTREQGGKGFVYIGKPEALAPTPITDYKLYRDGGSVDIFFTEGMLHFSSPLKRMPPHVVMQGKSIPLEDILHPLPPRTGIRG